MTKKVPFTRMVFMIGVGISASLYLHVPAIGTLPMLDLACYAISIPVLIIVWGKMGRHSRRSLLWGLAWTGASAFASGLNFIEMRYFLKSVAIVSSSWAIMSVLWMMFNKDARYYLYFMAGAGLGGLISIYYFKPGTLLAREFVTGVAAAESLLEKEKYPMMSAGFTGMLMLLCIWWKKFPSWLLFIASMFAGFFLLMNGGSRSSFGMYVLAAVAGYLVVRAPTLMRGISKHIFLLCIMGVLAAFSAYKVYAHMAMNGSLGEAQRSKFLIEEDQVVADKESRLSTRGSFNKTWEVVKEKPWGEGGTNTRHSVISNSLNCEGVIGLLFWVYFTWNVVWFVAHRVMFSGRFAIFFFSSVLGNLWAMIGSPFSGRSGYFGMLIFISLCRDQVEYGLGTVFEGEGGVSHRTLRYV